MSCIPLIRQGNRGSLPRSRGWSTLDCRRLRGRGPSRAEKLEPSSLLFPTVSRGKSVLSIHIAPPPHKDSNSKGSAPPAGLPSTESVPQLPLAGVEVGQQAPQLVLSGSLGANSVSAREDAESCRATVMPPHTQTVPPGERPATSSGWEPSGGWRAPPGLARPPWGRLPQTSSAKTGKAVPLPPGYGYPNPGPAQAGPGLGYPVLGYPDTRFPGTRFPDTRFPGFRISGSDLG